MKENAIEKRLKRRVEMVGGKAYKLESPGTSGMPDRLVVFKNGVIAFIETKKPKGGRLSERQKFIHKQLREYGQTVIVASTPKEVDDITIELATESLRREENES